MSLRGMHPKLAMDSVVRGVSILQASALQAAGLDLTTQQATVAVLLLERGEQSVRQLTSLLEIDQSAMTRLIDRLESKEFVRRSRSANDRRVVEVALTADGLAVAATAREVIERVKDVLLGDIAPEDLDAFWRVLTHMRTAVANRVSPGRFQ